MLTLKHHHQLHFPTLSATRPLRMSPVVSEDDELISSDDDHWTLEQRPDTDELSRYWNRVEADIASDPEWIHFDDDDE